MGSRDARRLFQRHRRRLPVRWTVNGAQRTALTADIAVAGLFVGATSGLRPGERVELDVDLPDGERVHLQGEVVWAKDVPPQLKTVVRGGFAVRLLQAPEAWYQYCLALDHP